MRRIAIALVTVGAALALAIGCCTPQLAMWSVTPSGAFDAAQVPKAPDYASDDAWLALPSRKDEADVALPALPATDQASAPVDVFYLHSTSSIAPKWNAPTDDPDVRAASIRGGTLIQASAFNACCAIYAPEYRQASGAAFVHITPDGQRAIDIAYGDVRAAFDAFRKRTAGRPFILAAHSQGSALAARLLREHIAPSAERAQLVVAYLIGAPITREVLGVVELCASPTEVGCVVTFNARGPGHVFDASSEFGGDVPEAARLCVNPTLGAVSNELVPAARHGGAVFFDAEAPTLVPAFAASQCAGNGRLVVSDMKEVPDRGAMSAILMSVMGREMYHPIEYQLFYADLRADAVRRVKSRRATDASPLP